MSIYDKASLVLIPSGTKTSKVYSQKPVNGDGDFTFSRSTAATRVNADGNIEKETQNLLLQSNSFDTTWLNQLGTGTITGGQAGYDGTNDAWLISKDTSTFRSVRQVVSWSGVSTFSVYAKVGTLSNAALRLDTSGGAIQILYDLTDGSVTSTGGVYIDAGSDDIGGGWYRLYVSANVSSGTNVHIYVDRDGTTAGNIVIQDAQLEQGLVARDVITTTTSAVEGGITDNVPRLDYTDASCPSLLLEPQRMNAMTFSEGLDIGLGINYKSPSVTLTPNDAESPEGYNNATKFNGSINNTADTYTGYTASTTNTFSAFLKAGTCDIAKIQHTATGAAAEITINLTSGTITNTTGAQYLDSSIVDYGDGWYRASITFTSGTTAYITRVRLGETGYIHMYGWQIERGVSYATSYIPTYGSAVTRNVENCSKTSVSDIIGQTEGTMYAEFEIKSANTDNFNRIIAIGDGTSNNRIMIFANNDEKPRAFVSDSGATQVSIIGNTSILGGTHKIAFAYKANDFVLYMDGVSLGTDTSGSVPSLSNIYLASAEDGNTRPIEGDLNQALLFKTRLSNAELADLTTI